EHGSLVVGAGHTADTQDGMTTLSIDPDYALPQGCLNKQVARWNGSGWFCSSSAPTPLPTGPNGSSPRTHRRGYLVDENPAPPPSRLGRRLGAACAARSKTALSFGA